MNFVAASTPSSRVTRLSWAYGGTEIGGLRVDDDGFGPATSSILFGEDDPGHLGERDLVRPADVDDAVQWRRFRDDGDFGRDIVGSDRLDPGVGHPDSPTPTVSIAVPSANSWN